MREHAEAIRDRLTELGWTVRQLVAPALTVQERRLEVVSVLVQRGMLRGHVVVLLASEDGDMADRFADLAAPTIARVSRRLPGRGWKIRAEVLDHERARDELACLRAALQCPGLDFPGALALFEQRGWQLDRERSNEACFDNFTWTIQGAQGGDLLDAGAVWSGGGSEDAPIDVDGPSYVCVQTPRYFASASVASRALAAELVEAF